MIMRMMMMIKLIIMIVYNDDDDDDDDFVGESQPANPPEVLHFSTGEYLSLNIILIIYNTNKTHT